MTRYSSWSTSCGWSCWRMVSPPQTKIQLRRLDTLITAFPRRWGEPEVHLQNPVKDAAIADMISKELSNTDRAAMDSPYDMMMTIIELCTGVLFNSAVHRNEKLRFAEFFVRRIQTVTNQEAESFGYLKTQFEQLSKENQARDKDETLQRLLDELLDISDEVSMLNEIKDVHDELEMVGSIFDTQIRVLSQMDATRIPPAAHKKWAKIIADIRQRRDKVTELDESAHRTLKAIQNLFDMKQRQANVLEAHYSRRVAQDSGRQATTVLVFTVVTIVFLPLSFMSSFFAIPVKEFPRDEAKAIELPLGWVSARLFSVAFAIAVAVITFVFGINAGTRLPGRAPPPRGPPSSAPAGGAAGTAAANGAAAGWPPAAVSASGFASAATGAAASVAAAAAAGARTFIRTPSGHRLLVDRKRVAAERVDRRSVFSYDSLVRGAGEAPAPAARYGAGGSAGDATASGGSRPESSASSPLRAAFAAGRGLWRWTGPAGDESGEVEKGNRAVWDGWREDGAGRRRGRWFWRRGGW
jgi:Mg2+ and Co2+ transporter CorA